MWKILYSGQTANDNMVHVQFMLIPKATNTHSQYGTYAVHADTSGYRHTLTIWYIHSSWWYLRLQTHTHNMVHTQSMLIPKATDTHSQYIKLTPPHHNNSCRTPLNVTLSVHWLSVVAVIRRCAVGCWYKL